MYLSPYIYIYIYIYVYVYVYKCLISEGESGHNGLRAPVGSPAAMLSFGGAGGIITITTIYSNSDNYNYYHCIL